MTIKARDLELIKELEKESVVQLKQCEFKELTKVEKGGYSVDVTGDVNGIAFYRVPMTSLPRSLVHFKKLEKLVLSEVEVEDCSLLQGMNQLSFLDLSGNKIRDISPLRLLTQLTSLSLSYNQISDISPIRKLNQLTNLDLRFNKVNDISPLQGLTQLKFLELKCNQIIDIAPILELTQLTSLDLRYNKINEISSIRVLTHLRNLDLGYNKITHLPREIALGKMDIWHEDIFLRPGLNLGGNPLESPPIEIIDQSPTAVRNYFEQLAKESLLLLESKLLIVGGGEVGKTSLMRKLLDNDFVVEPGREPTTHGIKIKPWCLSCSLENDTQPSRDINLSIWDFGGQAIYHST
ncbi:MAG: internalin, partial [Acidobacteriota bacterium]|nr:internalin [Acidobacteriota bacterium]